MNNFIRLPIICTALVGLSACGMYHNVTDTRNNPNRTYNEAYETSTCSPSKLQEGRCDDKFLWTRYAPGATVESNASVNRAMRR